MLLERDCCTDKITEVKFSILVKSTIGDDFSGRYKQRGENASIFVTVKE